MNFIPLIYGFYARAYILYANCSQSKKYVINLLIYFNICTRQLRYITAREEQNVRKRITGFYVKAAGGIS